MQLFCNILERIERDWNKANALSYHVHFLHKTTLYLFDHSDWLKKIEPLIRLVKTSEFFSQGYDPFVN